MDSDNIENITKSPFTQKYGFMDLKTNSFENTHNNDNNNIQNMYDDQIIDEEFTQSLNNIKKISKMNTKELIDHFKLFNSSDYNEKFNMYNKKYSNILKESLEYTIDYELDINENESLKFSKIKN